MSYSTVVFRIHGIFIRIPILRSVAFKPTKISFFSLSFPLITHCAVDTYLYGTSVFKDSTSLRSVEGSGSVQIIIDPGGPNTSVSDTDSFIPDPAF